MLNHESLALGNTFFADLAALLVMVGSLKPGACHRLDIVCHRPAAHTVATGEGALHSHLPFVESVNTITLQLLTFPKCILLMLCTIEWRIRRARRRKMHR